MFSGDAFSRPRLRWSLLRLFVLVVSCWRVAFGSPPPHLLSIASGWFPFSYNLSVLPFPFSAPVPILARAGLSFPLPSSYSKYSRLGYKVKSKQAPISRFWHTLINLLRVFWTAGRPVMVVLPSNLKNVTACAGLPARIPKRDRDARIIAVKRLPIL